MNLNGESTLTRLSGLMTSVVLCTTGLPPGEREEICNMARVMGAAVNDNLSRVTTHLVCVTVKGAKYDATMHPPLRGQVYLVQPMCLLHVEQQAPSIMLLLPGTFHASPGDGSMIAFYMAIDLTCISTH